MKKTMTVYGGVEGEVVKCFPQCKGQYRRPLFQCNRCHVKKFPLRRFLVLLEGVWQLFVLERSRVRKLQLTLAQNKVLTN